MTPEGALRRAPLDAVLGLGANLGDPRAQLIRAAERIGVLGTVTGRSALYETEPIGPPQPAFLNAALRLRTSLSPGELLEALLAVERALGRERRERWGPRLIDLDILWLAGLEVATDDLVVPHPALRSRPFALIPLLDVAPEAVDPKDGVAYRGISATLDRSGVRELEGTRRTWDNVPAT